MEPENEIVDGSATGISLFDELHVVKSFDAHQLALLGKYIYALRDPRDKKVFYVGQGTGERVLHHFRAADEVLKSGAGFCAADSRKLRRILDIWLDGASVEWAIIATDLDNSPFTIADRIESAVYDVVTWSINGALMNEVAPPGSTFLDSIQLLDWAAKPICPQTGMTVFLCNIAGSYGERTDYDATRMYWSIGAQWRKSGVVSFGVGLVNGISKTAYEIAHWNPTNNPAQSGKYEFEAVLHPNPTLINQLVGYNWRNIYRNVGYWLRGNPIIVEFDGDGCFRIVRGIAGHNQPWLKC